MCAMHRGETRVDVLVLAKDEVLDLGDLEVGHTGSRKCRNSARLASEGGANKSLAKGLLWWVSVLQNALAEASSPHLEPIVKPMIL